MKRLACTIVVSTLLLGCAGGDGGGSKVLQDFGLQDRPEGYVSGSERVRERLNDVGKTELSRLNRADRNGEILYDDAQALRGKYYKRVKVYKRYYPVDANAVGRTSFNDERGFVGYVEYTFEYYESPRKNSRAEAIAELADIPSGEGGRGTYRYRFNSSGVWNGAKGELVR